MYPGPRILRSFLTRALLCALPAVFLCGIFCPPAQAQPPSWIELRSAHFTVATDAGEKEGRRVLDQLERMRALFQRLLPSADADAAEPIVVLAFRNAHEFQPLEPRTLQGSGEIRVAGYALRGSDRNYILLDVEAASGQRPWATVYHEYAHIAFGHAAPWMPLWLSEGLAEFFQNTAIDDGTAQLGLSDTAALTLLRSNPLLPLPQLFRIDAASPSYHREHLGTLFYAESWALTHYLENADLADHRHRLAEYMQRVSAHEDPTIAAQQTFGDLHRLENDLKTWIAPGHHPSVTLAIHLPALDEGSVALRPLSPVQADVLRADLLARSGRRDEALALLGPALQSDPNNVSAAETMGFLALQQGDETEAARWYQQAARNGSQYASTWYYAAVLAANNNQPPAEVEAAFRTAIRLNPRFAPAYDALAAYECLHQDHLEEAQKLEQTALNLDPAPLSYRVHMADIHAARHDFPAALETLRAAAAQSRTPDESTLVATHRRRVQQLQTETQQQQQEQAENAAREREGRLAAAAAQRAAPRHATEKPHGRMHYVHGVLHHVTCTDPLQMELQLATGARRLSLYTNDWYRTQYEVANFTPRGDIHPCDELEGRKAEVEYFATADKSVDGQIVGILLFK